MADELVAAHVLSTHVEVVRSASPAGADGTSALHARGGGPYGLVCLFVTPIVLSTHVEVVRQLAL